MEDKLSHIILFDGICNLCNSSVQFIIKRDKNNKFRFASIQSEFGQTQILKFKINNASIDSFVYIIKGVAFIKSTAGLKVLREIGGLWKIIYLFIVVPKPLRDWVYDCIAKNRYRLFGKKESCMVPTPELKSRFLS